MICQRCGREQPALSSPCPVCDTKLGSVSSIPATPSPQKEKSLMPCRGGDTDPNILSSVYLIRDPVLRVAFLRAYRAWERAQ